MSLLLLLFSFNSHLISIYNLSLSLRITHIQLRFLVKFSIKRATGYILHITFLHCFNVQFFYFFNRRFILLITDFILKLIMILLNLNQVFLLLTIINQKFKLCFQIFGIDIIKAIHYGFNFLFHCQFFPCFI